MVGITFIVRSRSIYPAGFASHDHHMPSPHDQPPFFAQQILAPADQADPHIPQVPRFRTKRPVFEALRRMLAKVHSSGLAIVLRVGLFVFFLIREPKNSLSKLLGAANAEESRPTR